MGSATERNEDSASSDSNFVSVGNRRVSAMSAEHRHRLKLRCAHCGAFTHDTEECPFHSTLEAEADA
jgi:hypothetical protein